MRLLDMPLRGALLHSAPYRRTADCARRMIGDLCRAEDDSVIDDTHAPEAGDVSNVGFAPAGGGRR